MLLILKRKGKVPCMLVLVFCMYYYARKGRRIYLFIFFSLWSSKNQRDMDLYGQHQIRNWHVWKMHGYWNENALMSCYVTGKATGKLKIWSWYLLTLYTHYKSWWLCIYSFISILGDRKLRGKKEFCAPLKACCSMWLSWRWSAEEQLRRRRRRIMNIAAGLQPIMY